MSLWNIASDQARVIPYGALLGLMLVSPFEETNPSFRLPGLQLTYLEIGLAVVLLLWLPFALRDKTLLARLQPTVPPALLLLGIMLLSTGLAAADPAEAVRFCGRFAAGLLLYCLVLAQVQNPRRALGMATGLLLAGILAAAVAVLETLSWPPLLEWLATFRPSPSSVGGQLRSASTLHYPTIASMYLEISFGLGSGLLLYTLRRGRYALSGVLFATLLLIIQGVTVTQTRSGLLVIFCQLGLLAMLLWLRSGFTRNHGVLALLFLSFLGLVGYRSVSHSTFWLRLTTIGPEQWHRAEFETPDELRFAPGQVLRVPITVKNRGLVGWIPAGPSAVYVAYHWLDEEGARMVRFEGLRTPLPAAVAPGETLKMQARVQAPGQPGRYRLSWDMVQEHILWFSTQSPDRHHSIALVAGPPLPEIDEPLQDWLPATRFHVPRSQLWLAALRMARANPLLGVGPNNFPRLYGEYLGLPEWSRTLHTNNMYLAPLAETGVPGALLFLWFLAGVTRNLWRSRLTVSGPAFPLWLGVCASCLAILVHGLLDYFLVFTSTYIVIWATWGMASAFLPSPRQQADANRI